MAFTMFITLFSKWLYSTKRYLLILNKIPYHRELWYAKKILTTVRIQLLSAPVAWGPVMTMASVTPVTGSPPHSWLWRQRPVTTYESITSAPGFPLLIYPHMTWTRCCNAHIMWHRWPYIHYDLCMAGVRTAGEYQCQNKQHSLDTLHSMLFFGLFIRT